MNNFMDPNEKDGKGKFFDKYMGDGHQSITQIGVDLMPWSKSILMIITSW